MQECAGNSKKEDLKERSAMMNRKSLKQAIILGLSISGLCFNNVYAGVIPNMLLVMRK